MLELLSENENLRKTNQYLKDKIDKLEKESRYGFYESNGIFRKTERDIQREYVKKLEADNDKLQNMGSHYNPGDTVTIQRNIKIGDSSDFGFAYTRENYDECVKEKIGNELFLLESYGVSPSYDLGRLDVPNFLVVIPKNTMGVVLAYDNESLTIKLHSESRMSEIDKRFLNKFTKEEFTNHVRIGHRAIAEKLFFPLVTLKHVISCYLIVK